MYSDKFFKFYFAAMIILSLAITGVLGAVAYHFIHKYW